MKKLITLLTLGLIILINVPAISQVSFNTDGSDPDPSAMLDVKSTAGGMLVPRMTMAERDAINGGTFATSLLIYQTDNTPGYYYYDGSAWQRIVGGDDGDWTISGTNMYSGVTGNVGIGVASPTRKLDVGGSIHLTGDVLFDINKEARFPTGRILSLSTPNRMVVESFQAGQDLWLRGPGGIQFYSNGDRMRITNTGDVGIGTTSPSQRLHVSGNMRLTGALYDVYNSAGTSGQVLSTTGSGVDWVDVAGDADWTISGSNMYSAVSGNVGIGVASPTRKLDVGGSIHLTGDVLFDIDKEARFPTGRIISSSTPNRMVVESFQAGQDLWLRGPGGIQFYSNGDRMRITNTGNVGIGTTSPSTKFHVYNGTGSGSGTYISTIDAIIEDNSNAYLEFNGSGYAGITFNDDAASIYAGVFYSYNSDYLMFRTGGTDGRMVINESGNVGIGTTSPTQRLQVSGNMRLTGSLYDGTNSAGTSGQLLSVTPAGTMWIDPDGDGPWDVFSNLISPVDNSNVDIYDAGNQKTIYASGTGSSTNQSAIYGYLSSGTAGTAYSQSSVRSSVKGYAYFGYTYTFGTAGFFYPDYTRCGGVLGAHYGGSYWGSLGYKTSGSATYGGYFTSYTSGTGKDDQALVNNGIGAWGDLFGADIHGKVYGTYTEGENYAMYSNGTVYKNDLDVHLQKNDNGENKVLYTNVSTDATVQTMGYVTISNGKASVVFDEAFTQIVSDKSPVIVTATPSGESNGVYISGVNENGFIITENGNGKSNVTVSYIAIGKRKGYESPVLAEEVIAADYTTKLSQGLHNDGDTETDGQGLYYENGKLTVGIHPSTIVDPSTKEPEEITEPDKTVEVPQENLQGNVIITEEVPVENTKPNYPTSSDVPE